MEPLLHCLQGEGRQHNRHNGGVGADGGLVKWPLLSLVTDCIKFIVSRLLIRSLVETTRV